MHTRGRPRPRRSRRRRSGAPSSSTQLDELDTRAPAYFVDDEIPRTYHPPPPANAPQNAAQRAYFGPVDTRAPHSNPHRPTSSTNPQPIRSTSGTQLEHTARRDPRTARHPSTNLEHRARRPMPRAAQVPDRDPLSRLELERVPREGRPGAHQDPNQAGPAPPLNRGSAAPQAGGISTLVVLSGVTLWRGFDGVWLCATFVCVCVTKPSVARCGSPTGGRELWVCGLCASPTFHHRWMIGGRG